MRLDSNPLFRKTVAPWYDGNFACWLGLVFLLVIVLFAVLGIMVARQYSAYRGYQWVPWLLLVPSVLVMLSVAWRLAGRYFERRAAAKE
jgi:hypothetical protein